VNQYGLNAGKLVGEVTRCEVWSLEAQSRQSVISGLPLVTTTAIHACNFHRQLHAEIGITPAAIEVIIRGTYCCPSLELVDSGTYGHILRILSTSIG